MRHRKLLTAFLLSALLLNGAFSPDSTAYPPLSAASGLLASLEGDLLTEPPYVDSKAPAIDAGEEEAHLLSASAAGVTFDVKVPWERIRLEPATANGKDYVRVSLPGWATTTQAGAPELPLLAEAIGVPFGAALSVHVTPGPGHTLVLPAPALPAATQKVEWSLPVATEGSPALPAPLFVVEEDPAVYGGQAAYPRDLAQVASDGVLRQQRVAGIVAYPVQYDPQSKKLTVYESLRVEVAFDGPPAALRQAPPAESAVYDNLFRLELLNYESARQWRQPAAPSSPQLGAGTAALPWSPPVPGWRVKVRTDGLYKLTYTELAAKGLPVDSLDPRTLRLYNLGSEVAIHVEGEADGVFGPQDAVIFYGQAVASKYTADNVYWLTYGGAPGLRMTPRDGTPLAPDTPAYYPALRHMEGSTYYIPGTPGDDNLERWLWSQIVPPSLPSWTHVFSLAAPYAGPATLTVNMLGYLQNAINPDHHARISLNGTQVGDLTWDGIAWRALEMPIAPGLLVTGNNTVEVACPNDTGVGYDVVYIDGVELEFADAFVATGDVLPFAYDTAGTWTYRVDGFSSNQVAVYDVTNPAAVERIEGIAVVSSGSSYTARFQDSVSAPTNYWATATTAYQTVQAIEADTASNLRSSQNAADYILITHRAFWDQAAALRNYRASRMRAVQVDVQDVYDEFGYGIVGAAPIHDFLAYAYANWQAPAPSFVLLVGDGNYDPKDYLNQGKASYLPPYLAAVDPWITETAGDNRYVTLVGNDTFPDMMLGRLAVNSSAEASAFISKIVAYEQSPVPGNWQQQVLAVADNTDSAGNFAQVSDDLLTCCLREPYQAEKVYYGVAPHSTIDAARTAILAGINAGKLIVNYVGHASQAQWASESLFTATDVAGLANGGKLPVILPMTCYDGFYHSPTPAQGKDATAEVVTRAAGKGAVASWSPTGLGVASGHDNLDKGFFEALFQSVDGRGSLGQATTAGKLRLWATGGNRDLVDTYLLFGDPATVMLITYPTEVELLWFKATGGKLLVELGWETVSETNNLGFNLYRAGTVDGPRTKINASLIPSLVTSGSHAGAVYSYQDTAVTEGVRYFYWLEDVDIYGHARLHGPVTAEVMWSRQVYLPAILADR